MQAPPDTMPDCLGVLSLALLDQARNFLSEDICDGAAATADRIGVADAFGAIGIAHAAGDELERGDLAMRAVGKRRGKRDAVEPGLGRRDACHWCFPVQLFACTLSVSCGPGNRARGRSETEGVDT